MIPTGKISIILFLAVNLLRVLFGVNGGANRFLTDHDDDSARDSNNAEYRRKYIQKYQNRLREYIRENPIDILDKVNAMKEARQSGKSTSSISDGSFMTSSYGKLVYEVGVYAAIVTGIVTGISITTKLSKIHTREIIPSDPDNPRESDVSQNPPVSRNSNIKVESL